MPHVAIYFDASLCVECQACKAICNDEYGLKNNEAYLSFRSKEKGTFPKAEYNICRHSCNHCQEAPCVEVCPTGCLSKDTETGMTKVDLSKCSGCGYCEMICPYDSVWVKNGRVTKCVGCLERIEAGKKPSCVEICPTRALEFGDRDEIIKKAEKRVSQLKDLHPNANVFGKDQLKGLHLIMVLLDKPESFGLDANPKVPETVGFWKNILQPLSLIGVAGSAIAVGFMYIIARKNHIEELHESLDDHHKQDKHDKHYNQVKH